MKHTCKYTLITVLAILCFANADAQQKGKTKPVPAKTPVKKQTVQEKKVSNLAKSLTDTVKGGAKPAKPIIPVVENNGTLSEEIIVTTAYKPVLADAVKIRRNPDLEDQDPFKAPLTYKPLDKTLQQDTSIRQFDPIKLPRESATELDNNYAKVGIGNLKTSFGEVYINNGADPALQAGAWFKHLAQSGPLAQQNYNKEDLGIFGKSIGDVNSLSGRINYKYTGNSFYGYDELNPPTVLNTGKQHFSTLSGEAELAKNYKDVDKQFIYALKVGGSMFSNAYKASENNIIASGYINQTISDFYVGVSGSVDFTNVKDSLYSISNNIIRANPYIKFQGENYKIDAGITIVNQFGSKTQFNIFPAARLEWQIVPKYIRLFAEASGDVNKASIRDFSETNPFLGANVPIQNSIDQLDLSVGLKGMLAPGLGFKASIFRNSVKDMPLFVSNFDFTKGYNRFTVVYDNGKSRVSGFNGELDYKPSSDFDLFGRVEFKDYQLATEAKAWNLPTFKLTAGTVIRINNLISVNGSLMFRGNTNDSYNSQVVKISSFVDLSGGVEYKATNKISIFVQVNNLLSNNYQNWLYYPNYGFNIFGGLGYRF
ncbi:hypothetical protein KXQ82_12745 [Mucilaginibacter sp. HMF5004]|uniref:hypothetical protein n=1 Tax=Mucilaginibacter rivuli TaxID=2857527 RepID=UPI001C60582C|nr:hypothetical protein [Mucilaginibacter rivuli]MBW4890596.1 hypothetical protein [Mucilaginibacter rivuli]